MASSIEKLQFWFGCILIFLLPFQLLLCGQPNFVVPVLMHILHLSALANHRVTFAARWTSATCAVVNTAPTSAETPPSGRFSLAIFWSGMKGNCSSFYASSWTLRKRNSWIQTLRWILVQWVPKWDGGLPEIRDFQRQHCPTCSTQATPAIYA